MIEEKLIAVPILCWNKEWNQRHEFVFLFWIFEVCLGKLNIDIDKELCIFFIETIRKGNLVIRILKFQISIHNHQSINENFCFLSIIIDSSIRKELSFMSRFPFLPSDRMIYSSIQLVVFFSGNECFAMGSDKETYISWK